MENRENFDMTCHKHWLSLVLPAIVGLVLIACGVALAVYWEVLAGVVVIGITLLCAVIYYFNNRADCLTISDSAITGRRGFIKSTTLKSPLSKVQDVSISNGLMGKIFGFHTITVSTAGSHGSEYVFTLMSGAKEFQENFIEAVNYYDRVDEE